MSRRSGGLRGFDGNDSSIPKGTLSNSHSTSRFEVMADIAFIYVIITYLISKVRTHCKYYTSLVRGFVALEPHP